MRNIVISVLMMLAAFGCGGNKAITSDGKTPDATGSCVLNQSKINSCMLK
jgi:hypothetical protein